MLKNLKTWQKIAGTLILILGLVAGYVGIADTQIAQFIFEIIKQIFEFFGAGQNVERSALSVLIPVPVGRLRIFSGDPER